MCCSSAFLNSYLIEGNSGGDHNVNLTPIHPPPLPKIKLNKRQSRC